MNGVIVTMEKDELVRAISKAVTVALKERKEIQSKDVEFEEIMQTDQLCRYLKIKKAAIYQLTTYKRIPYFKKGKRLFFKKNEIDEWLRNGRKASVAHVEEEDMLSKVGAGKR